MAQCCGQNIVSINAAWGKTLLLLREGGLQAINWINVQPRLIKACPKVLTCGHVCVSVCVRLFVWVYGEAEVMT